MDICLLGFWFGLKSNKHIYIVITILIITIPRRILWTYIIQITLLVIKRESSESTGS